MTTVCNRDCFNCIYEDCIDDRVTPEEYQRSAAVDRQHALAKDDQKQKARDYYLQNREKKLAAAKVYYQSHKKEAKAYLRKYRANNRELTNARQRAWYAKHREEILARQREQRLKKRREAQNADKGC